MPEPEDEAAERLACPSVVLFELCDRQKGLLVRDDTHDTFLQAFSALEIVQKRLIGWHGNSAGEAIAERVWGKAIERIYSGCSVRNWLGWMTAAAVTCTGDYFRQLHRDTPMELAYAECRRDAHQREDEDGEDEEENERRVLDEQIALERLIVWLAELPLAQREAVQLMLAEKEATLAAVARQLNIDPRAVRGRLDRAWKTISARRRFRARSDVN